MVATWRCGQGGTDKESRRQKAEEKVCPAMRSTAKTLNVNGQRHPTTAPASSTASTCDLRDDPQRRSSVPDSRHSPQRVDVIAQESHARPPGLQLTCPSAAPTACGRRAAASITSTANASRPGREAVRLAGLEPQLWCPVRIRIEYCNYPNTSYPICSEDGDIASCATVRTWRSEVRTLAIFTSLKEREAFWNRHPRDGRREIPRL